MIIYLGGLGHGQAALCEQETGRTPVPYSHDPDAALTAPAIADFHLLIRAVLERGGGAQDFARRLLARNPGAALTCDEIGGGIVPLDPFERRWREETGRALAILAAAPGTKLVRVWYGLGETLRPAERTAPAPAGAGVPDGPSPADAAAPFSTPAGREILLLRHGRTAGNAAHRYCGTTDEPLSPEGRDALARRRCPQPEVVYVTRLRRTRETAAILFPAARQITVPGLREMDFGDFEGRSYLDMAEDAAYRAWVDGGCAGPVPNGEQRAVFTARVAAAFRALLAADRSERVTVVAHGGTLMAVCSVFVDPARDYFDWQPKNGGGYRLRTTDDPDRLELLEIIE